MRAVVVTPDVLGERMAGPAIRAWHLAGALASEHEVELVTTAACAMADNGRFAVRHVESADVDVLLERTDFWLTQGSVLEQLPAIARSAAPVVVDLYDPVHLENLELAADLPAVERVGRVQNARAELNRAMLRGDAFLVASEKQRDFWLGALAALGRINPVSYAADPAFTQTVLTVPFGVEDRPPLAGPALRGVVPGIGPDDLVLLWGGGLYNWFDPQSLIRAVDVLRRERDDVRLVFLGATHPNPSVPTMRVAREARELVVELDLARHVVFLESWVPYGERGAYLLDADLGVSTHLDHVETAFSFRTRILDYLWAGLPVVATSGDVFAAELARTGAGTTVPPGDVHALAAAIRAFADPTERSRAGEASRALGRTYAWELATEPLLRWARDARRAPDLLDPIVGRQLAKPFATARALPGGPGLGGELRLARAYLAEGGGRHLVRRVAGRVGRLARR